MRTLMIISSIGMIGAGIFCLANGSAAFISVAFVVGLVFAIMGIVEMLMGRSAELGQFGRGVAILNEGIRMTIAGIVLLAGQVTDDTAANLFFALWLMTEAVLSLGRSSFELKNNTREENSNFAITAAMLLLSLYMFFNNRILSINAVIMIGVAIILLGLNRFVTSFEIEYDKPRFLTGNEEKLNKALEEEKNALAKAKEGIREQKAAQKRISKIREDMAQEKAVMEEAIIRKHMAEDEKNNRG